MDWKAANRGVDKGIMPFLVVGTAIPAQAAMRRSVTRLYWETVRFDSAWVDPVLYRRARKGLLLVVWRRDR